MHRLRGLRETVRLGVVIENLEPSLIDELEQPFRRRGRRLRLRLQARFDVGERHQVDGSTPVFSAAFTNVLTSQRGAVLPPKLIRSSGFSRDGLGRRQRLGLPRRKRLVEEDAISLPDLRAGKASTENRRDHAGRAARWRAGAGRTPAPSPRGFESPSGRWRRRQGRRSRSVGPQGPSGQRCTGGPAAGWHEAGLGCLSDLMRRTRGGDVRHRLRRHAGSRSPARLERPPGPFCHCAQRVAGRCGDNQTAWRLDAARVNFSSTMRLLHHSGGDVGADRGRLPECARITRGIPGIEREAVGTPPPRITTRRASARNRTPPG